MQYMEQSPAEDEMYINLLINKAKLINKLASNSNAVSNGVPDGNISVEKVDNFNQILTLTKRVEKLEQDLSAVHNILQYTSNKHIAKHKKE
jgi:hypothetical protein